jgi:dihydroflavonol-4-reductase
MKILVTGADGVLGSNLVRELLKRNYQVSVLIETGKEPTTLKGLPITQFKGNILNLLDIDSAIEGQDILIHGAASTSLWPARSEKVNKINIVGTENMIAACLKHGIKKMIYIGTANSFGYGSLDQLGTENKPYKSDKYGLDYMDSKKTAQEKVLEAVQAKNLPALVVNPTFMIGPFDSKPSSGAMILAIIHNKIPCYTNGGKNYINVADAAIGIANAITLGEIGECYILGNENLTYNEMFNKIALIVNSNAPKHKFPALLVRIYGTLNGFFARVFRYHPSVTRQLAQISTEEHYYSPKKAVRDLKLPQNSIEIGIKECFDWFAANGYVKTK